MRTVTLEMEEYRELMMMKGKFISLQEYVNNAEYVDKDVVLAILGIGKKENKDE